MSAIVSGAAIAALVTGLAAAIAVESEQVQPHVLQVQQHGPPGPALIEKLESASVGAYRPAPQTAPEPAPKPDTSYFGIESVSEMCQPGTASMPMPEAALCALSSGIEPLLEPLLAGLDITD